MNERIGKNQYFFSIARQVAQRSTCLRRHVGSIIVDEFDRIIATGYNGAPAKQTDCLERGYCYRERNNIPSGEHYEACLSIHSENNALLQAGLNARNCNIYIYAEIRREFEYGDVLWEPIITYPCIMCSRLILNTGIKGVYIYDYDGAIYNTSQEIYDMSLKEMDKFVNNSG